MAITLAAFQTACDECRAAIASGTWATAWSKYAEAEAINAGLEVEASDADARYRRRESLKGLKEAIAAAEPAASRATDAERRLITTRTGFN